MPVGPEKAGGNTVDDKGNSEVYGEIKEKFDEFLTFTRYNPSDLVDLGRSTNSIDVMHLAAAELTSIDHIDNEDVYGLKYLLTDPTNPDTIDFENVRYKLTVRPRFAHVLGEELIKSLDNAVSDASNHGRVRYHIDSMELIRVLLGFGILDADTGEKLLNDYYIPYLRLRSLPGMGPFISDQRVSYQYRKSALNAWLDSSREVVEKEDENSADFQYIETKGLGRFMEKLVNEDELESGNNNFVFTEIVAFLESIVPQDRYYVRLDRVFKIAERLSDEDLKFAFLKRHIPVRSSDRHLVSFLSIQDEEDSKLVEWMFNKIKDSQEEKAKVEHYNLKRVLIDIYNKYHNMQTAEQRNTDHKNTLLKSLGVTI